MSRSFGSFQKWARHGNNDAGEGSYGRVFFVKKKDDKKTNQIFAGKLVPLKESKDSEFEILKQYRHSNIVSYIDDEKNESHLLIVTELLESSLYDALREAKNAVFVRTVTSRGLRIRQTRFAPALDVDELLTVVEDAMSGLQYLHAEKVVHRDIYPANILLRIEQVDGVRTVRAKLCDFGMARLYAKKMQTKLHNVCYSAPESMNGGVYLASCDLYSMGVVLLESLLSINKKNRKTFRNKQDAMLKFDVQLDLETLLQVLLDSPYAVFHDLVLGMTNCDPGKRDTIAAMLLQYQQVRQKFELRSAPVVNSISDDEIEMDTPALGPGMSVETSHLTIDDAMSVEESDEESDPQINVNVDVKAVQAYLAAKGMSDLDIASFWQQTQTPGL